MKGADNSDKAAGASAKHGGGKLVVPALPRNEVPTVEAVAIHRCHEEPLSSVAFLAHSIVTACGGGRVKFWGRPTKELLS